MRRAPAATGTLLRRGRGNAFSRAYIITYIDCFPTRALLDWTDRAHSVLEFLLAFFDELGAVRAAPVERGRRERVPKLMTPLSAKFLTEILRVDPSGYKETDNGRRLCEAGRDVDEVSVIRYRVTSISTCALNRFD